MVTPSEADVSRNANRTSPKQSRDRDLRPPRLPLVDRLVYRPVEDVTYAKASGKTQ